MGELTAEAEGRVAEIAARHGVSPATTARVAVALARSGGGQVQFNEPELGGFGQWSRGGMVMIGDMFNNALKARVDALCGDLAQLVAAGDVLVPAAAGGPGWPAALGTPSSSGAQNDMRYAVFPGTRRLAVAQGGRMTIYDTGDHVIAGASQAQSGEQTLTFASQHGPVRLADLAVVEGDAPKAAAVAGPPSAAAQPAGPVASAQHEAPAAAAARHEARAAAHEAPAAAAQHEAPAKRTAGEGDVIATIERLAELASRGILTPEEFARKKAELLDRL